MWYVYYMLIDGHEHIVRGAGQLNQYVCVRTYECIVHMRETLGIMCIVYVCIRVVSTCVRTFDE